MDIDVDELERRLRDDEAARQPCSSYMDKQSEIDATMRGILVDWLAEVHDSFRMDTATLHLCVHVLDRYLETAHVTRQRLQLAGITALWIASKFEDVYDEVPLARDMVYLADSAYTKAELIAMERAVLEALGFVVGTPTAHDFLGIYLAGREDGTATEDHMARYIAQRTLREMPFVKFLPSLLAAGCILLARRTMGRSPAWTPELERASRYSSFTLEPCVKELVSLMASCNTAMTQFICRKFTRERYHRVAEVYAERTRRAAEQGADAHTSLATQEDGTQM